ncbi:MAG: hypothetical protein M3112_04150 [Actinomycetia bacterium]|nr:hypothetical protein [Actinomycetes bacterium]
MEDHRPNVTDAGRQDTIEVSLNADAYAAAEEYVLDDVTDESVEVSMYEGKR